MKGAISIQENYKNEYDKYITMDFDSTLLFYLIMIFNDKIMKVVFSTVKRKILLFTLYSREHYDILGTSGKGKKWRLHCFFSLEISTVTLVRNNHFYLRLRILPEAAAIEPEVPINPIPIIPMMVAIPLLFSVKTFPWNIIPAPTTASEIPETNISMDRVLFSMNRVLL
jgi:hypothetical protein